MSKTTDFLAEALRDSKHPFRAVGDRPKKPQKHRYERRKARECLKLGDWSADLAVS
jgi:hypothetical protein